MSCSLHLFLRSCIGENAISEIPRVELIHAMSQGLTFIRKMQILTLDLPTAYCYIR